MSQFLPIYLTSCLSSFDSKNRFRIAPEGMICVSSMNLYGKLVSMFGLDQATVVLKVCLSLGESLRNYSFYMLVLLNVYLAVSMCDSFEINFGRRVKGSDLSGMNQRLSERKQLLMIGLQTMTDKLGVRFEFEKIYTALKNYSDVFGVKISILD